MIRLRGTEPFATGGRRWCYEHPGDPGRCIKVLRTDEGRYIKTGRTVVPSWMRREYDNNEDERRSLVALQRRLGEDYRHLPACDGYVETDLGRGLVLGLVRDADGRIARSVREALRDGVPLSELRPAYDEMAAYFVSRGVLTRAILDHNLTAEDLGGGSWRVTLIDGFGDRAWVPLRGLIPALRKKTARERTARGWARIEEMAEKIASGAAFDRSRWGQGILDHRGGGSMSSEEASA